jgi:ectoine hydroxylase-related dioxygenase (phytanoyl-CoA dioxygenase family)
LFYLQADHQPSETPMNRLPLNPITDEHRRTFEDDGVIVLRGMFDGDWVERMREASLRVVRDRTMRGKDHTRPEDPGFFRTNLFMWMHDADFRAFVYDSPAAEIAGRLMGVDRVHFFYDQLFVKEPGTEAVTYWHQDLPFWPVRGNHIPSIWLALTPIKKGFSGLEHIAGSHRWGKFYSPELSDLGKALADEAMERCPNFSLRRNDPTLRFHSPEFEPGDVVVHHPLTVHGSGGNFSTTDIRVALSTRWFGDDCYWDRRPKTMIIEGGEPELINGQRPFCSAFPLVWQRPGAPSEAAA